MTKIKICGLTRPEDAVFAANLGADFLGMIFISESPRYLTADRAAAIANAVRQSGSQAKLVGVFRNATSDLVQETARRVGLDIVQLHGVESDEEVSHIGVPAIKTLHVSGTLPDTQAHPHAEWLLFDTFDGARSGGTGRRFDWSLLSLYERKQPFLLAGGLNADNVAAAISMVRPDAIDVASGVESAPGIKDHDKMERLFERVKP
jgi:phosphoribosylanthranilate isomerase